MVVWLFYDYFVFRFFSFLCLFALFFVYLGTIYVINSNDQCKMEHNVSGQLVYSHYAI